MDRAETISRACLRFPLAVGVIHSSSSRCRPSRSRGDTQVEPEPDFWPSYGVIG